MTRIPSPRSAMTIATVCIILLTSCHAKPKAAPGEYYSKEFNWRVTIPAGFEVVPDTTWSRMQNKGAAAMEQTVGGKVENRAKTIFVFRQDKFDYFESNCQPYDHTKWKDYLEESKTVGDILYQTFMTQIPNASIDSSYTTEAIGGLGFHLFSMDIHIDPQATLHMRMYSRLFEAKEFSVNILYVDPNKGKPMLDAWRKSSFGKS
jgi:hypothetical protein